MSKVAIFGAGIIGQAVYALLKQDNDVVCFFDNKPSASEFDGVPVIRPAREVDFDKIYISITDLSVFSSLKSQLLEMKIPAAKIRSYKEVLLYGARVEFLREFALPYKNAPFCAAEVGVFKGEFAREINEAFSGGRLYLFDTFEGFCESDISREDTDPNTIAVFCEEFRETSVETVLSKMPEPDHVIIKRGFFPETFDLHDERFIFVSLDADLYQPTKAGLEVFAPLMVEKGVILVHDYYNEMFPGVKKAVDEFLRDTNAVFLPIGDAMSLAIIKTR
ncbi:MAG: TylF/MycF family methyltransferase [Oscillospiraceae bacterium]|jgi:hypothetical protein|nr:TylF/MycF family methyltransferase [Oscillospiraceae bacterium]